MMGLQSRLRNCDCVRLGLCVVAGCKEMSVSNDFSGMDPLKDDQCQLVLESLSENGSKMLDKFFEEIPIFVQFLCRHALENAEFLNQLVRRSYWHPLGFSKIVLVQSNMLLRELRINYWGRLENLGGASGIHDHCWDLWSTISFGRFQATTYDLVQGDDYSVFRTLPFDHAVQSYDLLKVGKSSVRPRLELMLGPQSAYILPAGELHTFLPKEVGSATIMLQQPFQRKESRVLLPFNSAESVQHEVQRLPVEEVVGIIALYAGITKID
jgi:hypothetical protein